MIDLWCQGPKCGDPTAGAPFIRIKLHRVDAALPPRETTFVARGSREAETRPTRWRSEAFPQPLGIDFWPFGRVFDPFHLGADHLPRVDRTRGHCFLPALMAKPFFSAVSPSRVYI